MNHAIGIARTNDAMASLRSQPRCFFSDFGEDFDNGVRLLLQPEVKFLGRLV